MTNLEHLVENGLVALENGRNYNEWLEQMKEDINWDCCERLTIDDLWEICQYVFYVWTADRKTEPTISKMEQVDKDINVRRKDEPTTQTKTQKSNLSFEKADEPQTEDFKACVEGLTLLWIYNYVTDDEFHRIDARLKCKGEPQTENLFTDKDGDVWEWRGDAWYCISGDEPQTDCPWK